MQILYIFDFELRLFKTLIFIRIMKCSGFSFDFFCQKNIIFVSIFFTVIIFISKNKFKWVNAFLGIDGWNPCYFCNERFSIFLVLIFLRFINIYIWIILPIDTWVGSLLDLDHLLKLEYKNIDSKWAMI